MNTRVLGADLEVSSIGLGCMGFSHAYGAPTEKSEAIRSIRAAYDMGYTLFDTAETYGTAADPHENEKLVGEALKDIRDHVQIVTKFGTRFDETSTAVNKPLIPDSRPETIRASVEGSLRRLGTDHIDLYFQHRMDPGVEPETVAQVMADLIREGKITHWGVSEANGDYLRRAHAVCPVTAVQNRYSIAFRPKQKIDALEKLLNISAPEMFSSFLSELIFEIMICGRHFGRRPEAPPPLLAGQLRRSAFQSKMIPVRGSISNSYFMPSKNSSPSYLSRPSPDSSRISISSA